MGHVNIMNEVDYAIQAALRLHATDLDIRYCLWRSDNLESALGKRCNGTTFYFENIFRHPDLPEARIATMPTVASWPPSAEEAGLAAREGILDIQKLWVARLAVTGKLPASGWEHDLVITMKSPEAP
jgi:hypothetical protein